MRPCLYFYLIRVSHSAVLYLSVPASLKPLYIFVSQSVNERVKGGSYNSIQRGYRLSLTVGIRTVGLNIDSCDGSIEESYYQEVGPTSARAFSRPIDLILITA